MIELARDIARPRGGIEPLADMAVEVAIGALGETERPVNIDAEGCLRGRAGRAGRRGESRGGSSGHWDARHWDAQGGAPEAGPPKQASTSLRKATARWLMRCFSAGSISP